MLDTLMAILRRQKCLRRNIRTCGSFRSGGAGENEFSGKRNYSLANRERKKDYETVVVLGGYVGWGLEC
ncbi:hypothetical protein VNO80_28835 [Phaseolus coccineus]|uniref:Uncharacterized protein n=1 Tax=Phaseolus coccineus TaxID=3886 RepID=A0AAN9QHX8_PHACN